ncbi:hypothetical protein BKP37_07320 [Anaerobacillus alkalilacustris]|uniref:Tetratricopeptide repeat protein n=1 Tax=Anaerobacillus alkalilacustris TaxID=393763 RepID=A0A1S2LQK8_9BACI|nr:tetratricopeptide repeat protein [Anaerobacillus alkalilacustris]OIJ14782.1 hypothetical protein BKP37_07320 [Anaerobacillus alkalilacustris]
MEKWVNDWYSRYWKLKKAVQSCDDFNEKLFEELATECGALLDTWMEMEDKLEDIKEIKSTHQIGSQTYHGAVQWIPRSLEGPKYFDLEIFDKAIETLKVEIEKEMKNEAVLYLYLGFSYLYEGELDKAKETFLYVLKTSLNKVEKHFSYVGLGCLFGRRHHYEEAINYFEKANSLYSNTDVPYNIGMAFVMMKKYELALPYLLKIIEANEDDGEAQYFLGHCYLQMGDESKAFEAWYSALQVLEFKDLLVTLAYEFELYGYYTAAIHCYKRLQAIGFDETWVHHGIAWNYGLLDQKSTAIDLFEKLVIAHPKDTNIWISYIWLLSKWDQKDQLRKIVLKLKMNNIRHPLIEKILS